MNQPSFKEYLKIILELGKVRISLPVSLSALTGYVMVSGWIGAQGWLLALGVFLMSCASGAINHIQEHRTDALMPRTKNRPIPSGKISVALAIAIASAYLLLGSAVLLANFGAAPLVAAFATLLSYNIVYTPLKKITAFAVVPGSLVGALPPYIGWLAAGGDLSSPTIFLVALFFFIGQIPHFWLLLLLFGDEYKLAGYPSLHDIFNENQIKRLSFTWILATIAAALLVALKVLEGHTAIFILIFYIFYLLISLTLQLLVKKNLHPRQSFYKLNVLYLLMMIVLIVDSILHFE